MALLSGLLLALLLLSSEAAAAVEAEAAAASNNGTDAPVATLSAAAWDSVTLDCPAAAEHSSSDGVSSQVLWVIPGNRLLFMGGSRSENEGFNGTLNGTSPATDAPWVDDQCESEAAFLTVSETDGHLNVAQNGSLIIRDFGWADRGSYKCLVPAGDGDGIVDEPEEGGQVEVELQATYREHVYYFSLLYGAVSASGLLLLTLLFKLVYWLLETYGCCLCCCCCENQLPPKAKKIKVALESIEAYKAQQLDKLKDNYTQQSDWIRQNCAQQMEKVRENYSSQVQNIKEIRQYGSSQVQAVREQYFEQMNRIRDYSSGQLDRVHENYIFQRQRLRKFSAQNYLRMRATGKSTQRTLNKVIENLPPLYLDLSNCRQGMGGRQESMHFPDDFNIGELEPFDPAQFDLDMPPPLPPPQPQPHLHYLRRGRNRSAEELDEMVTHDTTSSLYFTPRATPQREVNGTVARKTSSLKSTPTREAVAAEPYRAVYKTHRKSKSFGSFLPQKWFFSPPPAEQQQHQVDPVAVSAPTGGHQRTVRAIIEHVASSAAGAAGRGAAMVSGSSDYLDEGCNIQAVEVRDRTARPIPPPPEDEDDESTPLARDPERVLSREEPEEEEEEVLTVTVDRSPVDAADIVVCVDVDRVEDEDGAETEALLANKTAAAKESDSAVEIEEAFRKDGGGATATATGKGNGDAVGLAPLARQEEEDEVDCLV